MLPATTTATSSMPLPPVDLRERVSGTRDEAWFDESGARTVSEWQRVLIASSMRIGDFKSIVDFGCGCGRALRHLVDQLMPGQTLTGMDTDCQAIAWLDANITGATVKPLPEQPPGPMANQSADLVLSHSVFTHLPEQVQFAWLADLRRILRPGGVLIASIHGQKATGDYLRSLNGLVAQETIDSIRDTIATQGFYHVSGRSPAEQSYPQYYGAAFHTIAYIAREWLKYFDLVAWHPLFALDHQDVLVLRAKHAS
jgi:SAM-dependent methyltransferase